MGTTKNNCLHTSIHTDETSKHKSVITNDNTTFSLSAHAVLVALLRNSLSHFVFTEGTYI